MRSPRAESGFEITAPLRPMTHLCASSSTQDTSADATLITGHGPIITIAQRPHAAGLTLPPTADNPVPPAHGSAQAVRGSWGGLERESDHGVIVRERVVEVASSIHGGYKARLKHRVTQKTSNGRPCPHLYGRRFLNLDLPLSKALESMTSCIS